MIKNVPFRFLLILLGISFLAVLYFQISFIGKIYSDEKYRVELAFLEGFERIDREHGEQDAPTVDLDTFLGGETNLVIYKTLIEPELNGEEMFMELPMEHGSILSYSKLPPDDVDKIKDKLVARLKPDLDQLDFELSSGTQMGLDSLIAKNDLVVGIDAGLFGLHFNGLNDYLMARVKGTILSSLFLLVLLLFCSVWLVRNYLAEKRALTFKNNFINNLTHEFRTPLTISDLALQKLGMFDLGSETKKYLEIVRREQDNMSTLSRRILGLAEIEKPTDNRENLSMNRLLKSAIERFTLLLQPEDRLDIQTKEDDPILFADRSQCMELLDNLLSNAIKYANTPRKITVVSKQHGNNWILEVADNGNGIPKEFHKKVFEPFFKVPDNKKLRGHGLGLSYCNTIVTVMKGHIKIRSEPDKGTCFTVKIPCRRETT